MEEFMEGFMRIQKIALRLLCMASIGLIVPGSLSATKLFQPAQVYRSGGSTATSVAVADLNHDGKPDLVVANVCVNPQNCDGAVGVLLGNGDGTFQTAKTYDTGNVFASSVAIADVNGDGKPDIMVSNGGGCSPNPCIDKVAVLLGKGDGTFGVPQSYPSAYNISAMAGADVNGDGKPDLLVTSVFANPNLTGDGALSVLLGNGDGSFGNAQSYDSGSGAAFAMAVGDLNGDGKLDAVIVHEQGVVGVLSGNGDGSFQAAQTYPSGGVLAYSIAIADINGDGKPDLLVTNSYCTDQGCPTPKSVVGVLLGNGNGTFQAAQVYSTGASLAQSVAVADVNGDGKPDLIVAHRSPNSISGSAVAVLLGNGDGTFQKSLRFYSGGQTALSIAVADVNQDGKPDLLVGNKCLSQTDCTTGGVGVLLGTAGVKTTTSLTSSLNPSTFGHAVTFTATIVSIGPQPPTGKVKFWDGTLGIGSATLSGGVATLTKSNLAVGTHLVTAQYLGDVDSGKSTSSVLNQVVQ
jgi:Bacterial Ig-like domain (group 3)/FG-GAP-like repeat